MASGIVGPLVKNLISLLTKQFSLIKDVKKDVKKLVSVLSTIQDVLKDAEEQQINNKPISNWLRKIKDATYYAEDVLDEWAIEIQDHNQKRSRSSRLNPNNVIFSRQIAKKVQKVIRKFDKIAEEKSKFHLNIGVVLHSESQYSKDRETTSVVSEPHVYGAQENVKKIVDILVNTFVYQDDVSVCPIVGMGGLGKTTLAQSVYNDERIKKHFELKIWVCVSEPFDVKRILEAITGTSTPGTLEAVRTKVEEILRQKRYLLVLDDVWNEKQDQWDKLKSFLKGGAKGSSVVLTTRSSGVADITGTIKPCLLGRLSDDDCFSLFKHHALGDRGEELHPNLAVIGKQIAKKCKGVPLVAKSLGSLLRFKTSEKQWESVRDSEIWALDETTENTVLAALRLSYNHLSSRLKQCFAYCAIFPKDSEMKKNQLIYLWIANGFIQCQGKMELEEVGDDVFNELLRLSFFQEPKTNPYLRTTTCKMHDLMHDLASGVAKNECFIAKIGETKDIPKTIRHLSVVCDSQESRTNVVDHLLSPPLSLRTLSFFHSIDFHTFQFSSTLRVLDLSYRGIQTLPPSICDLIHLRYLDLSWNFSLVSLPESIHKLRNLLMLDLSRNQILGALPLSLCKLKCWYLNLCECSSITSLPEGLGSMSSLRHLDLSECSSITSLPEGLGSMSSLRHLDLANCSSITSLPEGLGSMSSLIHLDLANCSSITSLPEGLGSMSSLRHLDLSECSSITSLPEGLGSMSSLRHLNLANCSSITSLPEGLGSMSSLRHLDLTDCSSITSLPEGLGSMSSLRHLNLSECSKLSKMPVGIGKLTGLETLNWFVVGNWLSVGDNGGGGASISELQGLNQLRGKLEIHGLENVINGENAKEANLSSKTHLSRLKLWWSCSWENVNDNSKLQWSGWKEDVNDNSKEVLEGLLWLLNNNITSLEIFGYKAAYFPEVFLQNLKSLKLLELWHCDELVSLPEGLLQKLTSLERLEIRFCDRLKSLGFTWCQGYSNPNASSSASSSSHFHSSSLQVLSIKQCGGLQFSEEDFHNLDALHSLTLNGLDQLIALPQGIEHLPMLRELVIYWCENLRIFPAWVKRRKKEKGEEWYFYCRNSNIKFGLEEEDANEPATEETTYQVNNDENTIIELDGSATEPISDNPNIEFAPDEEANELATEELNANMQLDEPATEELNAYMQLDEPEAIEELNANMQLDKPRL